MKAVEYSDGSEAGTIDLTSNSTTGVLLFEFTFNKTSNNISHSRMKITGTMSSSFEFSTVSDVSGIKIVCEVNNGCLATNGGYSGATVSGAPASIQYEAIWVAGGTCNVGDGCIATTGTSCSGSCITFTPTTSTFATNGSFSTDITDVTSGPICFTSVTEDLAPTRSTLSSCSL